MIKCGIIGCGKVGDFHARGYLKSEEAELTAVVSGHFERAEAFAKKYDGVKACRSIKEMTDLGVQAVSICTPHPLHAKVAVEAIECGMHVAIEKPLASSLEDCAAEGELDDYWFLQGIERGHRYCLEGFLFPDTYEFYMDDDPRRVLEKFLDDFNYRFTNRMVDKFVALNNKTGLNLSLYEVITMASIIEKEKAANTEGYKISSVFYNRLVNASTYPYLNSDATILYATDYYNAGELVTDAQINASPYNTYTQTGLPPTPIANPGLSSLDAALEPEDTNFFYFILDREQGFHRFSTTLAEHERLERELGYR